MKKIKFTVESENKGSINFLDVTIIRSLGKPIHRWYKKHFASSRLINYFSKHEKGCIMETARAYVRMVLTLSDESFFQENKLALEDILRRNSFPEIEISNIIRENYTYLKPLPKSKGYDGKYVPIKFRDALTHKLKEKIHPFIPNARLVGVPDRINSMNFSFLKDPIEITEKTNIVIIFICECGQKIIMRHTEYKCSAEEILRGFQNKYILTGKCSNTEHAFTKMHNKRCDNYSSMRRVFDMYAYSYKDKLCDTVFGTPTYGVTKQLKTSILRKSR